MDTGASATSPAGLRQPGSPLPYLREGLARWRASPGWTLVAYGLSVLGFAVVLIGLEVAVGDTLVAARSPGVSHSFEDAFWHLGTGLALALPARRWSAAWMASLMTLGLDVDHIFGDLLPTVVGRTDHCLVFLVGSSLVLYALQGRTGALLAAGAVTAHISLDGGAFPLLAPASTTSYPLPFVVTVIGAAAAAACFALAFRSPEEVARPRSMILIGAVVALCAVAFLIFTSSATFLVN